MTMNPTGETLKAGIDEIVEFEVLPLIEEYWMDDPAGLDSAKSIIGKND